MSFSQSRDERTCPDCGALLSAKANCCWLCGTTRPPAVTAAAEEPPDVEHRVAYQFSLASMVLTITLVAVLLGVFQISLGAGIVLTILAAPAFVRTCITAARTRARGQPMSPLEKVAVFASAFVLAVVVAVAAGGAFLATCWAGFFGGAAAGSALGAGGYEPLGWGMIAGFSLGGLVGLVVGFLLIRRLWRRQG